MGGKREKGEFNTATGKGDIRVVQTLKRDCRIVADKVLANNPLNFSAHALKKWANDKTLSEPNILHLMDTFQAAGGTVASVVFEPHK